MARQRSGYDVGSDPGLDWPRALALICGLAFLAPTLLLGVGGLFAWRTFGWRRYSALLALVLSFVPAAALIQVWSANPIQQYLEAQMSVIFATISWVSGRGFQVPDGLTPLSYVVSIAPAALPTGVLLGLALAWLTRPKPSLLRRREATPLKLLPRVERQANQGIKHPPAGWALGYRADGAPVAIADAEARHHVIVCGATGAGKTTVVRHVLDGVAHRFPLVILDCKASPALRQAVKVIPGSIVWTIGGSSRWDALGGDPTCFAAKLLAAEQFSPNAAIYRAAAERYAQSVGWFFEWTGLPRDPEVVADLLAPKAFTMRLRELRATTDGAWWQRHGAPLQRRIAELGKAEEEGIAGFAARFGVVAEGVARRSLGAGAGALVLEEAIHDGRTVLFSLDAAAYPTLAAKLGAWILLDLVRVAGLLQEERWLDEGHQCYVIVDEFSALREEGRHIIPLLARAREAGVACVVATQGLADLDRVDRALPQQVVQNTAVRILLRQQSHPDSLAWAYHIGEFEREELSRRLEPGGFGQGERDTGDWSTRWRRDFYVRPEELQALATGEAIVQVAPVIERRRRLERIRIAQPQVAADRPARSGQARDGGPSRRRSDRAWGPPGAGSNV